MSDRCELQTGEVVLIVGFGKKRLPLAIKDFTVKKVRFMRPEEALAYNELPREIKVVIVLKSISAEVLKRMERLSRGKVLIVLNSRVELDECLKTGSVHGFSPAAKESQKRPLRIRPVVRDAAFSRPPTFPQLPRFDTPLATRPPGMTLKRFILQETSSRPEVLTQDADFQMVLTESRRLADKAARSGFRATQEAIQRMILNIQFETAERNRASLLSDD